MITNWKLGIKTLRYAYGIKANLLMAAALTGIILLRYGTRVKVADIGFFGDYMLICVAMLPTQLVYSLSASNLVTASPVRKKMQTSVPAAVTCVNMIIVYLILTAVRGWQAVIHPELMGKLCGELIQLAVLEVMFMVYLGIAYKWFLSMIFFIVLVVVAMVPYFNGAENVFAAVGLGTNWQGIILTALLGMGAIVAGGFAQYLMSCLLYRRPLSKMAQSAPLRREL